MDLFREQFKGYAKYEVERFIQDLEKENKDLRERYDRSQETVRELKFQLQRFQEREGFISDVLVDAKLLSQNLLSGSRQTAEEEARSILKDANDRLAKAEQSLERLSHLESTVTHYEETLKAELRVIFEDYLERAESLNFDRVRAQEAQVLEELEEVRNDLHLTKTIVSFPDEHFLKPRADEAVPVYSLDAFT